jgi:hypothetical protein
LAFIIVPRGVYIAGDFGGLAAAELRTRKRGALGLLIFRERGVHGIGTVVFTVSA